MKNKAEILVDNFVSALEGFWDVFNDEGYVKSDLTDAANKVFEARTRFVREKPDVPQKLWTDLLGQSFLMEKKLHEMGVCSPRVQ